MAIDFDWRLAACNGVEDALNCKSMKNGSLQIFLTPKQIASEMEVDYRHFLRKLARREGPKFKRYGARYLIRKDWYEKWIEEDNQKCSA